MEFRFQSSPSILEMIDSGKFLHIAAPMVRWSKLPFRLLCRQYNTHVAYTHMIISEEFVASAEARLNEFTTNSIDQPTVVQFAAKDPVILAKAAQYVSRYCSGIDINCGCPQSWAMRANYGAALLKTPQLIQDMVRQVKSMVDIPCSIKVRIIDSKDPRTSVELARRAEHVGTDWITIHGRTPHQSPSGIVDYDTVKIITSSISIPVFGNGSCYCLNDASIWREKTGVKGVMAARGLLQNPALFAGFEKTPIECIRNFVELVMNLGVTSTRYLHRMLAMMLSQHLTPSEIIEFNSLQSSTSILDYLDVRGLLKHYLIDDITYWRSLALQAEEKCAKLKEREVLSLSRLVELNSLISQERNAQEFVVNNLKQQLSKKEEALASVQAINSHAMKTIEQLKERISKLAELAQNFKMRIIQLEEDLSSYEIDSTES